MRPAIRAVIVALLQAAIVLAVGGKLLYDRATLPRVWVETAGVDPYLPIRGRYVRLRLVVTPANPPDAAWVEQRRQQLEVPPEQQRPGSPAAPPGEATFVAPGTGRVSFPVGRLIPAAEGLEVELLKDAMGGPDVDRYASMHAEGDLFDEQGGWILSNPIAFFLPEHVEDPTRLPPGESLWAEVTVPPDGPPRPIRLAVR